jgi:hypothetical protein
MAEQVSQEEVARAVDALAEVLKKSQIISHLSPYDSGGMEGFAGADKAPVKPSDVGKTVAETDYIGVKKSLVSKAQSASLTKAEALMLAGVNPMGEIAEKVAKGENLTDAEVWAVKGGAADAIAKGEMKDEGKKPEKKVDRKGDVEREVGKEAGEAKEDYMKSLQALAAIMQATQAPRANAEVDSLRKALSDEQKQNAEFRDLVTKSLAQFGQLLAAQAEAKVEPQPQRGPRAALRAIDGGQQAQGYGAFGPEEMTKKSVSVEIRTRLEKGDPSVSEEDLLAWESDLQMRPELKALLSQSAAR